MPSLQEKYIAVARWGRRNSEVCTSIVDKNELVELIIDIYGLQHLKYSDIDDDFQFPHVKNVHNDLEDNDDYVVYNYADVDKWIEEALSYNHGSHEHISSILRIKGRFSIDEY